MKKKNYSQKIVLKKFLIREFEDGLKIVYKNVCTMMKLIFISLTSFKRMDRK